MQIKKIQQKLYIYYVYIHIKRVCVKKRDSSLGDPWAIIG